MLRLSLFSMNINYLGPQKEKRHCFSEFTSELRTLGIPSEIIAEGIEAVKQYAAAKGISLPKELVSSTEVEDEGNDVSSQIVKSKESSTSEEEENDQNQRASKLNKKSPDKTFSHQDKFKGTDQIALLNQHFLVKHINGLDKTEI